MGHLTHMPVLVKASSMYVAVLIDKTGFWLTYFGRALVLEVLMG